MLYPNTTATPASHRAAGNPSGAASRLGSVAASIAKPLTATLMVLAIAASVVLAVALPEPTPAAAQAQDNNLVTITVEESGGNRSASDANIEYSFTPVPDSCDSGVTVPAAQTFSDGTTTGGTTTHQLDSRCSWQVEFCQAGIALSELPSPSDNDPDPLRPNINDGSFKLTKVANENKLVWLGAASAEDKAKAVGRMNFFNPQACTRKTVTVKPESGSTSAIAARVIYTLSPTGCNSGFTAPAQDQNDGRAIAGGGRAHVLDARCSWNVEFCGATVKPSRGATALMNADGAIVVANKAEFTLTKSAANDKLTYTPPTGAAASTDSDTSVTDLNFTKVEPGCITEVNVVVRVVRPGASPAPSFLELSNTKWTLVPVECNMGVTTPASQTQDDTTRDVLSSHTHSRFYNTHLVDARCDWQVNVCEGIEIGLGDDQSTDYKNIDGLRTRSFVKLLRNRKLENAADPDTRLQFRAGRSTKSVTEVLIYGPSCAQVAVAPAAGSTTSATAANVEYSFTPSSCTGPSAQANAAGLLRPATGELVHQLAVSCDWTVQFCVATVKLLNVAADPDITHATIPSGSFQLSKNTATEMVANPTDAQEMIAVVKDEVLYDASSNTTNKAVDQLEFSNPLPCAPFAMLHADSDSGAKGDAITNDTTPTVTVSNATAEATVALTATKGSDTVSKTADVPAGETSVDVEFTETLAHGEWVITGTHTPDGSTTAATVSPLTLNIDTMTPTVEISANPASLTVGGSPATITFEVSEEGTDFDPEDHVTINTSVATLSNFTEVDDDTHTATLTAVSAGTAELEVAADEFTDAAGNDNAAPSGTNGDNGELHVTVNAAAAPSNTPTLEYVGTDTGSSASDKQTSDITPTFRATGVTSGATVVVTAAHAAGATKVYTKTSVSGTSIDFNFADDACGAGNDESCDLDTDGVWTVTATQTAPGELISAASTAVMLTIDTVAPTMTIAGSQNLGVTGSTTLTFTASEPITGFIASDITLTPSSGVASLTGFAPKAGAANTWEATLTGTGSSAAMVTVSVADAAFEDTAGTPYGTSSGTDGTAGALQVSFTAGPPPNTAPLTVTGGAVKGADSGAIYTLTPVECDDAVTRTPAAQTAANVITVNNVASNYLDHRCDWKLTFESSNAKCWASAFLQTPTGDPISFLPGGTSPYELNAAPGATVTIYLASHESGFRHTLLTAAVTKRFAVGSISLHDCASPNERHRVPVIDNTPADINVDYSFVPVQCAGSNLPPVQTKADGRADVVVGNNITGTVFELNYLCDWDFIFSDSTSNCKVEANVNAGNHPRVTSGKLRLLGDLPQSAAEQAAGQTRYINQNLHYNYGRLAVHSIILTEDSSTAAGDCGQTIELSNSATGAGQEAVIEFKPVLASNNNAACTPEEWMPVPPKPATGNAKVTLAPQESQNVVLDPNCNWDLSFTAGLGDCALSIQFKDTSDMDIGSAPISVAAGATSHEVIVLTNPLRQGLSHTPRGGGSLTVVGSVEINACASGPTAPANTHKVTVIDEFLPLNAKTYNLVSQACSSGGRAGINLTVADADVTGNEYVHYLDYRCDWALVAEVTAGNPCKVKRSIEAAGPTAVHHTDATTAVLTLSGDATGEQITYSDNSKVVNVVRLSPDNTDNSCVTFVNVSTPLPISVASVRSEDYSAAKQNFDIKSPQIVLNLVAHDGSGAACTPGSGSFMPNQGSGNSGAEPGNIITVNAATPNASDETYTPSFDARSLDHDCNWRVEFHSAIVQGIADGELICQTAAMNDFTGLALQPVGCGAGDQLVCTAVAQVLGVDGTLLGNPVGNWVSLTSATNGLTYPGADGTATAVGSIEFTGCLEAERPGTTVFQVYDDSGTTAGDFTYSLTPSACDGFALPATQTKADAAVFGQAAGVYQHMLHRDCDWEVAFTGTSECEAAAVWSFGESGLEYVDSVLAADGATSVSLKLRQIQSAQFDEDAPRRSSQQAREDGEVYDALRGFAYFPGGQLDDPYTGSTKGELAGSGLPPGNAPGPDEGGGLPSAPGYAYLGNSPAGPESLKAVNAVSLECASVLEISTVMGLESPGIELSAATTVTAPTNSQNQEISSFTDCVTSQSRLPGSSQGIWVSDSIKLTSGDAPFSLVLDRDCTWELRFASVNSSCRAAARIMSAASTPVELGFVKQSNPTSAETIPFAYDADGVMYTPTGGSATEVGAIEFYNCFYPSVALRAPSVSAGSEVVIAFANIGSQTNCGTVQGRSSQTVVPGSGQPVDLSNSQGTTLYDYFASQTKLKHNSYPAVLHVLADDNSLCEYEITLPVADGFGALQGGDKVLTVADSTALLFVQPLIQLSLENKTATSTGHTPTTRRNVEVTLIPASGCATAAPAAVELTPGQTKMASLGVHPCGWTLQYQNAAADCQVSAQQKNFGSNVDTAVVSAGGIGTLALRTRDGRTDERVVKSVNEVEFTVAEMCFTTIPVTFSITGVTDDQSGNYQGTVLQVLVEPTSASPTGCTTVTVPLTLGSDNTATATQSLAKTPLSTTDTCEYTVTFEARKLTMGNVILSRDGAAATDTVDTDGADDATVSRAYTAVYAATVTLENDTAANHANHPLANMANVVVTPGSGGCAANPSTATNLSPTDTQTVTLGLTDCTLTLTFRNQLSNCQVSAQAYGTDGTTTVGSPVTSTSSADGSLTLSVDNLVTKLGAAAVGTIKFSVDTTGANCTTFFDGEVNVSVTDTGESSHATTVLTAPVSAPGSACTTVPNVSITLGSNTGATTTASQGIDNLVGTPWGGSACSYTVTFPAEVTSTGSSATTVVLERVGTPPALSAANDEVTVRFNAVRPATVTLKNETTGTFTPTTRANVRLTPGTPNTCRPTDTATIELDEGSADNTVSLGTEACSWTIAFRNQANDCQVTAQLKQPDGTAITPANTSGSLTLHVTAARKTMTASSGGTEVGSVEFTVGTCTTTFNGTLSVTVTDAESESHSGTVITVPVSSVGTGCSRNIPNATITLGANSGASTTATATVSGLTDKPWNQPQCVYTAAFPGSVDSMAGTGSEVQLRTSNTSVRFNGPTSAASATASAAYTASRAASLSLNNVTSASSAHTPATRRNVALTPGAGTCTPDPSTVPTLNPGASQSVSLGTTNCTWSLSFSNPASDCVVSAQPKSASGNAGSAVRGVSGTLQFSVDGEDREVSHGGQVVTAVDFTVTSDCDATFNATVSVSSTNEVTEDSHAGTTLQLSISSASGVGCSPTRTASITLNSSGSGSASVTGLVAKKAGTAVCSYTVAFPASEVSAGNSRIRLVRASAASATLSAASSSATASYITERIPDPPVLVASVSSAGSVTEGQPLVFRASMLGPATQPVELGYAVSSAGATSTTGPSGAASGTVTIAAGQSSTVISIPTDDDDLDEDDQTIRVTLTSAGGGASIDPIGRSATGIVKDNDAPPVASLTAASIQGDRLRITVELSEVSGRQVRVNYTVTGGSGIALIAAGQQAVTVSRVFDSALAVGGRPLTVRLTAVQNANLDLNNRERSVRSPSQTWQFHVVSRAGTQPTQIAESLGFGFGWSLHSWSDASQRWVRHTAASGGNARLAAGTTIVFRGSDPSESDLVSAGLGRPASVTLRQGWNIFTPASAAVGLVTSDFQRTANGGSAVFFDTRLIDCDRIAGVLVIYTYDQLDSQAQNGFRVALPCHPQLQRTTGIPAITSIDANDTIYAWFNSTTRVNLTFANGQYSPA